MVNWSNQLLVPTTIPLTLNHSYPHTHPCVQVQAATSQLASPTSLRLALEALCGQQQQQKVELLKTSSSNVDFVEHIRALEEQLVLKNAEVKDHRAAATDAEKLLRGLEERVGQSTAALQNSLLQGSSVRNWTVTNPRKMGRPRQEGEGAKVTEL